MKYLITTAMIAMSVNAMAFEIDTDEKYMSANIIKADFGGTSPDMGFAISVGAPLDGVDFLDDSEKFVEAGYANLGEYSETIEESGFSVSSKLSATALFALGKVKKEIEDDIYAYGSLGMSRVTADATASANGFSASTSSSEFKLLWGAGIEYSLESDMSLKADYVSYASDITSFNVGLNYSF